MSLVAAHIILLRVKIGRTCDVLICVCFVSHLIGVRYYGLTFYNRGHNLLKILCRFYTTLRSYFERQLSILPADLISRQRICKTQRPPAIYIKNDNKLNIGFYGKNII